MCISRREEKGSLGWWRWLGVREIWVVGRPMIRE